MTTIWPRSSESLLTPSMFGVEVESHVREIFLFPSQSLLPAFLIRPCPSFHIAKNLDVTGSKSGVVMEVKHAVEMNYRWVEVHVVDPCGFPHIAS